MTPELPADAPAEGRLLTRAEAAEVLSAMGVRMKAATLARLWSTRSDGPPVRHIRSKPYYPRVLLEGWGRAQISELRTGAPPAAKGRRHG
ncbi:hypothetical protein [Brevundimonas goettingensis]|uniref:Uncharacterized protein n=1 Tax=Brevundimonas goettingensis TaxID=2774190 RepID=A0A975C484_9CAUL|nr:hypothetical protein [Brevundimonas goettingensis]QTC92789.1 hypothetical protein IFJ75_08045 [Brevundimonas goettingensis]